MRKFLIQFVEKPPGRWFVFVQKDKWPSGSTLSFTLCLPLSHSFQHFLRVFFFLISTLSSLCLCLAVFSISAFWSVFTFIFAFSCWAFLTQFTIAYHIKILLLLFAHVYNATVQGYNCTDSLWIIWMSVQNCPHGMIQGPIKNWSNIDNLIRCAKTC